MHNSIWIKDSTLVSIKMWNVLIWIFEKYVNFTLLQNPILHLKITEFSKKGVIRSIQHDIAHKCCHLSRSSVWMIHRSVLIIDWWFGINVTITTWVARLTWVVRYDKRNDKFHTMYVMACEMDGWQQTFNDFTLRAFTLKKFIT